MTGFFRSLFGFGTGAAAGVEMTTTLPTAAPIGDTVYDDPTTAYLASTLADTDMSTAATGFTEYSTTQSPFDMFNSIDYFACTTDGWHD